MKRINVIVLTIVLIILFLGVEVVLVKSASNYEPLVTVVYAKAKIPAKTVITTDMLQEKKINVSLVNRQAIGSIKQIVDKKARSDIEDGEMVLQSRIGAVNEMENIPVIDKNNRLYTLELRGDQANGWWLMVGQYVDIIYVPSEIKAARNVLTLQPVNTPEPDTLVQSPPPIPASGPDNKAELSKLKHIRIAALIDDKGTLLKNTARETIPKYITLEVADEEVDFLAKAKETGILSLAVIPEHMKE